MFNGLFQPTHLILILVVVLILFGPGKLPDAAKAMGNALRDMRNAFANSDEEVAGKNEKTEGVAAASATPTTSSTSKISTTKVTD